jgi:hypothetical protein
MRFFAIRNRLKDSANTDQSHCMWTRMLVSSHLAALAFAGVAAAQGRVESNVVYGMYSGLALLLDVYVPNRPNGFGIITVPGTGWHLPTGYAGPGQKGRIYAPDSAALLAAGYTVFRLNHRAAPRFPYPAALEDAQRAVRYVRFHAGRYGIDPEHLGGWGFSSGAHLVALLGVLDGAGDVNDPDPVNRVSARFGTPPRVMRPLSGGSTSTCVGGSPGFASRVNSRVAGGAASSTRLHGLYRITGRTIREGYRPEWWTTFSAITQAVSS